MLKRKKIIILILIITSECFAGLRNDDLEGKSFSGTATEITPPNIDRAPIIYEEFIKFENGKFYSNIFKKFLINECAYAASEDDKRAIALRVISFIASASGKSSDGQDVYVEIAGSVLGETGMTGTIIIHYPDTEVKFLLEAKSE